VTQGKEAEELMCVGVSHLDSLQEAWIPKQELLVSQRIKREVNRLGPLQ
jgi:hypothetical protein